MRFRSMKALAGLAAVLAFAGIAAASASAALPEFSGGAKGKFPLTQTSNLGETTFETVGARSLSCTSGTGRGEITGAKTVTDELTFKGCKYIRSWACNTEGAAAGEIRTKSMNGVLVYTSKATKAVGIAYDPYEPETIKEFETPPVAFANVKCGEGGTITLNRTLLASMSPINKSTSSYAEQFRQYQGKQEPNKYENKGHEWEVWVGFSGSSFVSEDAGFQTAYTGWATNEATEIKA